MLRTYLATVGLESGLTLLCALPFVLFALWRSRTRGWVSLAWVGALVVLSNAIGQLPRATGLQHLHWNWQATLLTIVVSLRIVRWIPGLSLSSMGVTSRLAPGWFWPSLVALLIAGGVPAVFFVLGSRVRLTGEGWLYLLLMPGLAEEILFRGLVQPLLNRALGQPWRWAGAQLGWSLVITAILFAGSNGLVSVDPQLHARIVLPRAIAPFMLGLVSGWVRERTGSVWPSVFGHNLSNIVIPVLTSISGTAGSSA